MTSEVVNKGNEMHKEENAVFQEKQQQQQSDTMERLYASTIDQPCAFGCQLDDLDVFRNCQQPLRFFGHSKYDGRNTLYDDDQIMTMPMDYDTSMNRKPPGAYDVQTTCEYCGAAHVRECPPECTRPKSFFRKQRPPFCPPHSQRWDPLTEYEIPKKGSNNNDKDENKYNENMETDHESTPHDGSSASPIQIHSTHAIPCDAHVATPSVDIDTPSIQVDFLPPEEVIKVDLDVINGSKTLPQELIEEKRDMNIGNQGEHGNNIKEDDQNNVNNRSDNDEVSSCLDSRLLWMSHLCSNSSILHSSTVTMMTTATAATTTAPTMTSTLPPVT